MMRLILARWLLLQAFNIIGVTQKESELAKQIWSIREQLNELSLNLKKAR